MMLGLKRDLRQEGEGIIYPQEVCDGVTDQYEGSQLTNSPDLSDCPRTPLRSVRGVLGYDGRVTGRDFRGYCPACGNDDHKQRWTDCWRLHHFMSFALQCCSQIQKNHNPPPRWSILGRCWGQVLWVWTVHFRQIATASAKLDGCHIRYFYATNCQYRTRPLRLLECTYREKPR